MALHIVTTEPDPNWRRSNKGDGPADTLSRKIYQAEALASVFYAETGESYRVLNDAIQDRIHWLMADLLTDIHEAWDAVEAERADKGARREAQG